MSVTKLHVGPRLSQVVIHGDTVYLTGCIAERTKGKSVREQTREILATIDRLLAQAGSNKTKVLTASVYLADIATYREMNAGWDAWVSGGEYSGARDLSGKAPDISDFGDDRLHRGA